MFFLTFLSFRPSFGSLWLPFWRLLATLGVSGATLGLKMASPGHPQNNTNPRLPPKWGPRSTFGPQAGLRWPKQPPKLRKTLKMITGMTPKRPKEMPNYEKMTSQPMPIFIFVHLVPPALFALWFLILGGDPSGEDGTVAGTGAKRH